MFESTGLLLAWIACTYFLAQIIIGVTNAFREVEHDLKEELHKRLNDIVHRVKKEQHGDFTYWYDSDNGSFLAQGRNQEEIIAILRDRFPTHIFYLDTHEIIGHPTWELRKLPVTGTQP